MPLRFAPSRLLPLALAVLAPLASQSQTRLIAAQQPHFPTTYPQHFTGPVLDHLATLPFDGIVVTALPTWNLMDPEWTWTEAELDEQFQDVGNRIRTAAPQLQQNLFGVVIEDPGDVFDDAAWTQAVGNWRTAAAAARSAGFAGFYFDVEEYGDPWLNFPEDYDAPTADLAAYREQTRLRGRQVMEAVSAEWPDALVLFTFGPWLSEPETPAEVILFQAADADEYELLGPLFVGFLEGAGPDNLVVDGGEVYQYRTPEDFGLAYEWREVGIASDDVDSAFIPEALRPDWGAHVSNGFGVYNIAWQADRGYDMDPAIMETTLANALRRADDLVWFYTEEFEDGVGNWYVPGSMPEAWFDAVRAAREAAEPPPRPSAVGEAGTAGVPGAGPDGAARVSFASPLVDPVVVVGPLSYEGAQPAVARVRDVDGAGFTAEVVEYPYLDGRHAAESVGWLALERGVHTLAGGGLAEAGTAEAGGSRWVTVAFEAPFAAPPVVLASAASADDPEAAAVRLRRVTATGFQVRLQNQETDRWGHGTETVAYVALARAEGARWTVRSTGDVVTHNWARLDGTGAAVVLATMQSTDGGDTAALRASRSGDVSVFVQEETSRDSETRHTTETVGYAALAAGPVEAAAGGAAEAALAGLVAEDPVDASAPALSLAASPNPVRQRARVDLVLPRAGRARVDVVDVLGRRVRTVADAEFEAGPHALTLDAAGLAPGVYVVRASGGGETASLSVTVVR